MTHAFCSSCGTGIYQCPSGASFRALFPVTFHIEDESNEKSCLLPPEYLPTCHLNYENRLFDWHDSLPKYKAFKSSTQVTNEGTPIE